MKKIMRNNFRDKIAKLHETGVLGGPEVFDMDVKHDAWCRYYKSPAHCNCNCEITVKRVKEDGTFEIVFVG